MDDYDNSLRKSTAEEQVDDVEDQQDETLSLRDLPLTPASSTTVDHHHTTTTTTTNHSRRSSDFLFEFLVNHDDHVITSPADDVIFGGRLLPFAPPPPRRSLSLSSTSTRAQTLSCELLLNESKTKTRSMRPCRSLDYRKLSRNSNQLPRNSSNRSSYNADPKIGSKLRWFSLLPVRVPAEMELKDIKNRQYRLSNSPASLFSGESVRFSGDRNSSSASWRFLNVLSCKNHASIDVTKTTSLHYTYPNM